MELKRVYDHKAPKSEWVDREEVCRTCKGKGVVINETLDGVEKCPDCVKGIRTLKTPPVVGVQVKTFKAHQKFSTKLVAQGMAQGWLNMAAGEIQIAGDNKSLIYKVDRMPGYYCCHCGNALPDGGVAAQEHIRIKHGKAQSPDPTNPSGYEKINCYDCTLIAEEG